MLYYLGEEIDEEAEGVVGPAAVGALEREEADPLVADAAGAVGARGGFDEVHLHVEGGAAELGEGLAVAEHVVGVFSGRGEGAQVGGQGWWVQVVGGVEGQTGFGGEVGNGDVAFDDGHREFFVLVEGEMQVRNAGAEFDVADSECCRAYGGASEELEVEVDRMWLCAFGVRVLHVCTRADEEGGGRVAAIGDSAYAPRVFKSEGVGVRREGCDREDVCESDGSHHERLHSGRQVGNEEIAVPHSVYCTVLVACS